jgi:drug/metabolite transporter (DMT)-like permease
MLCGGAIIVFSFAFFTQVTPFNFEIFMKWGILLSLFGTIIPPMLLNAGFPLTGIGLGSIVSALELPVSVLMAYFLLNEQVVFVQWLGIILIILAIVLMNINFKNQL